MFYVKEFLRMNFDCKNGCGNEFKVNTKNHADDPEIRFLIKLIAKPYGRAMSMPPG